jgi:hypothetical protein
MEPLTAEDPQQIGEFRLHARLGAGGMGQVYLGFSPAGRPVAIKVVHSQFARDQEFLQRFSREVAAAGAVSGMYTAPVVGSGLSDSPPWLATAYVPGPPLGTVVTRYGPLPTAAVWRLAAGLAEALHAVHAAGLVHRDLKPANVLLADDGPHVIDFGISRAFQGTQLTSAGMVIGTPGYMSPEQAEGTASGPPSDVFSLGCVLTYATTGNAPFGDGTPATILYRVVRTEPDLTTIPPPMRQLIEGCLKKNPAERPDPGQLISLIAAMGPATTATLGSFWPEEVARVIAGERASITPAGLTPPGAMSAPGPASFAGAAALSEAGAAPVSGAVPVERTPTALAAPSGGQPLTGQPASGPPFAGPPFAGPQGTGHAPMISDGYYAAAAQAPQSYAGPPGAYGAQPGQSSYAQPYTPVPGGQVPLGQAGPLTPGPALPGATGPSGPGGPYPSYGGPQTPAPWQQPPGGAGTPWPGQGAPGLAAPGLAGGQDALAQYARGRRNPMSSEIPPVVQNAIRAMYAGFVVTVLDIVLSIVAIGRYDGDSGRYGRLGATSLQQTANNETGFLAIGVFADFIGLACWVLLALACRRGRGWTRATGIVLAALYTVVLLVVELGTKGDPGPRLTTLLVWVLGIAAVIPLYSQQARQFFQAWRR